MVEAASTLNPSKSLGLHMKRERFARYPYRLVAYFPCVRVITEQRFLAWILNLTCTISARLDIVSDVGLHTVMMVKVHKNSAHLFAERHYLTVEAQDEEAE